MTAPALSNTSKSPQNRHYFHAHVLDYTNILEDFLRKKMRKVFRIKNRNLKEKAEKKATSIWKALQNPVPGNIDKPKEASQFELKIGAFFMLGELAEVEPFKVSSPHAYINHYFEDDDFRGKTDLAFSKTDVHLDDNGREFAVMSGFNPFGKHPRKFRKYKISTGCRVLLPDNRNHFMIFGATAASKMFDTQEDGKTSIKPIYAIRLKDLKGADGKIEIGGNKIPLGDTDLYLLKHPVRTGVWRVVTRKHLEFFGEIPAEKISIPAKRPNPWANYGAGPKTAKPA